ncbi:cytochrome P450 [Actinorugispora endophytica]|uniref:Cytochrome P450 n=1 Tax=Actinorugispora endophytica TaxID=1605990 RepID=A0A4R6UVE7_9ACTN|nr:cytochrome P450 [Actinorugispora endophytica]TDQ50236.1 cytochrome P450 [Actinorugispora endophytica]
MSSTRPTPGSTPPPARCPARARAVPLYRDARRPDHARLWEELRARFGAVAPVEITPGVPGWLLLGYHENLDVLRDPSRFSADPGRSLGAGPSWGGVLAVEGERHRRLRAPIVEGLAAAGGRRLSSGIRRLAGKLVDGFAAEGHADLIASYAAPLPAMVLNLLFGLGDEYGELLAALTSARDDGDAATAERAAADVRRYVAALVERRRADPGDDFVSRLLAHPAGLADGEAAAELLLLLNAGLEPTTHLIGNALRLLLTGSETAEAYRGAALPAVDFLDYVMWVDPPLQTLAGRYPTHDVRIGGVEIKEGEPLFLGFAPAHADPATRRGGRGDVDAFAGNRAHLMWGAGPHGCPAQALACEITLTAIDVLLDRLDGLALERGAGELRWRASLSVHGLVRLPVRFAAEPGPAAETRPVREKGARRVLPASQRRPRARGARYGAPGGAGDAAPGEPVRHVRAKTPRRLRATGARYGAPARQEARPADPLESLLARWGRDGRA